MANVQTTATTTSDGDDEQTQSRVIDEWIERQEIMRIQAVVVVVGFLSEVSHGIRRRCIRGLKGNEH